MQYTMKYESAIVPSNYEDDSNISRSSVEEKSVTFGWIEIREYELVLGDNIACRKGPPISIGDNYVQKDPMALETYEVTRNDRRSRTEFKIRASLRKKILKKYCGYSEQELIEKELILAQERRLRKGRTTKSKKLSRKRKTTMIVGTNHKRHNSCPKRQRTDKPQTRTQT